MRGWQLSAWFGFSNTCSARGSATVNIPVASHTMPSLDEMFGPLAIAAAALAAALATLVASSSGAKASAALPWGRHTRAVAAGLLAGWGALAVLTCSAMALIPGCSAALAVLLVGTVAGVAVGRSVARAVAARLTQYSCRRCGANFRSLTPAEDCAPCASAREAAEVAQALAQFGDRYRELRERGRP